jgi:hypothetical protein
LFGLAGLADLQDAADHASLIGEILGVVQDEGIGGVLSDVAGRSSPQGGAPRRADSQVFADAA